jgi:hypothetical protein
VAAREGADRARRYGRIWAVMHEGSATGVAYASSQHTAGLWNHGFNESGGGHVYMTRTDGGASEGVVAEIVSRTHWSCNGFHGSERRYSADHVHKDGYNSLCQITVGGHISSPGPYLGHHEHN